MEDKKVPTPTSTAIPLATTNTSSSESGKEQCYGAGQQHEGASEATTPSPAPRPEQPPPRTSRRVRRRRHHQQRQRLRQQANLMQSASGIRRRLQSISQDDNQIPVPESSPTGDHLGAVVGPLLSPNALNRMPLITRPPTSNSAVRVLFGDQLQQQLQQQQPPPPPTITTSQAIGRRRSSDTIASRQQITGTQLGSSSYFSTSYDEDTARLAERVYNRQSQHPLRHQRSMAVVEASRRLVERQIEAVQEADSRRWNFDFRRCRPMNQPGHRYVDCTNSNLQQDDLAPNDEPNNQNHETTIDANNNSQQQDDNNNSLPALNASNTTTGSNQPNRPAESTKPLNDESQTQ